MESTYHQRFGGIARLYGNAGLDRLRTAHVCIIGVGGVGSWIVEALARSGIGALTLIDMDDVCITNINRQLPALDDTLGLPKVRVLAERVGLINPECRVNQVLEFITPGNVERHMAAGFTYVIDAVDRMSIKTAIIAACHAKNMPMITLGSAGGRRDPTQIRVTDLGLSGNDLLLQQVRRKLRKDHGWAKSDDGRAQLMGVPCVFTKEHPIFPWADGSCSMKPEPGADTGLSLDCAAGFGAATHVTGAFAFAAVGEVLRGIVERAAIQ